MKNILFFIPVLISFTLVYYLLPKAIKSLESKNITSIDHYKIEKPRIANQGASIVLFSFFLTCSLMPVLSRFLNRLDSFESNSASVISVSVLDSSVLLVIAIFGLYGVFDDLVDIGWWPKIIFPICFSFPLMILLDPSSLSIPFYGNFDLSNSINLKFIGKIEGSDLLKVFLIPVYIMVCSNLVNMHSGFNGLQSGLSIIILATLILKSIIDSNDNNLVPFLSLIGGLIAFWIYNKYPAKIIEGNIGSLSFGAAIGTFIIVKELYFFGIFIILPHIIDFLLFMYVRLSGQAFIKFGDIRTDGTIKAPNPFKLKFLFPHFFRLTERESVFYLYCLTSFFCISGLLIF